ncbi:hypothetical protein [Frondihabitans sucicola]|uniref:hypothetical protein n=1 Tax=Frondihabitans sucicola TaxID=1268041 RepID=UPI002572E869|nr:hypothetical protein [Frondihabitans sucicola]
MTVNATQPQPDSNVRTWLASPRGIRTWTYVRNALLAVFVFFAVFSIFASFGAEMSVTFWGASSPSPPTRSPSCSSASGRAPRSPTRSTSTSPNRATRRPPR